MPNSDVLEIKNVHHWFGPNKVLYDVHFNVRRGQFLGLVGKSGCGKSTLLRAIVGTHPPRKGELIIYNHHTEGVGSLIQHPGRDRGIVYQQYSLFPFLTAVQNVAYGLMADRTSLPFRLAQWPRWRRMRKDHLQEAADWLNKVGLGAATNLYPAEMSGGMRQRVAIAQALIMKPEVLLLDEPFGALDEAMRESLQRMLLTLYAENTAAKAKGEMPPYTLVIVTHELYEAIYVGDRVVGLSQHWDWKAAGLDAPPGATVVYDKPAPTFLPDEPRDYVPLKKQRDEILDIVFSANSCHPRGLHCTWPEEV